MNMDKERESLRAALERKDEELSRLHQSNQDLREGFKQTIISISSLREQVKTLEGQIGCLQERVHTLEGQQAKDSHNSSLPPSSDRFIRPVKSLRQKSGKKLGGQAGHRGHHLRQAQIPDEILLHQVQRCEHCQHDLHLQPAALPQRRQVIDLPTKRVWITEHWVEEKQCPQCYHLTRAPFPAEVKAPAQ